VAIAKGVDEKINDGKITEKVDKVPIVGTLSQGATAAGHLYGDAATGNTAALKADAAKTAKAGVLVAGAYGGSLVAGSAGVVGGAQIGEGIATKGVDIGALTGAASAYFGNTLQDNFGFDLNTFLPKPGQSEKPTGGFDLGTGSVGKFFGTAPDYGTSGEDNTLTIILAGAALIVVLFALKRRK
jgi:hypothetical protein